MNTIKLFIVDDEPYILKNLVKLLSNFNNIEIVGTALSGETAIEDLKKLNTAPDIILCDLGMPNMNGIELTKNIKILDKRIKILIFTVFEDENKVLEAITAGADGYLLKGAVAHKIYEAINDIYYTGSYLQPTLTLSLLLKRSIPVLKNEDKQPRPGINSRLLSLRELECLQMLVKGLSNKEVARVLNLSKATIRTHLENIYKKLEATNRVEAIAEGLRQGIIEL